MVVVVVVTGQLRQHGSVGSSWIAGADDGLGSGRTGAGAKRCCSRLPCAVAFSFPAMVMVELACTVLFADRTPAPPSDGSIAADVMFTAQPLEDRSARHLAVRDRASRTP